jgi:hypothetical protein
MKNYMAFACVFFFQMDGLPGGFGMYIDDNPDDDYVGFSCLNNE